MPKSFVYEKNRKGAFCSFVPEAYEKLAARARRNNRSISRELVDIAEKALKQEEAQLTPELEHK